MESIWTANKAHWQDRALCAVADPAVCNMFTPAVESDEGLLKVQAAYCNRCPVRDACLNSAIIRNDIGYWGGTSSVQRRAMRRTRSRSKCPLCSSKNLVRVPHTPEAVPDAGLPGGWYGDDSVTWYEVCVNCAASWKADDRPTPQQEAAEKTLRRPSPALEAAPGTPVQPAAPRRRRRPGQAPVVTVPLTEAAASCL